MDIINVINVMNVITVVNDVVYIIKSRQHARAPWRAAL
jgi:hypothetical protein